MKLFNEELFAKEKELINKLRKKVNSILLGTNCIDRIMTEKVEDYILIEEMPLAIKIGDRTIYIGNLTLDNNYKFWLGYGKILAAIGTKFANFDMIADGAELYKVIMTHKRLYKDFCKLIYKTICKQQAYYLDIKKERKLHKWKNCSLRYLIKNMTMEKLIQMLYLIYIYNFDAEKKNLSILLGKMAKEPKEKELLQTYMYFWLANLAGLTGKFQLSQLTNVDYWLDDTQNEIIPIKEKVHG